MSNRKAKFPRPPKTGPRPTVDAQRFLIGDEEFAVISLAQPASAHLDGLTSAERDVCTLLLRGFSNADIARSRGTSVNTVENQIASIFRKLDINSRSELAALCN